MAVLKSAEDSLSKVFKGLPPLPAEAKESLAKAWPVIALVFGVLQLFIAWGLWDVIRRFERVSDAFSSLSLYYTGTKIGLSASDKTLIYIGILMIVVDAVILLMAYPALKARSKKGWDLLFLATLINVAYAVFSLFIRDRGVGSLISSLLGSAVSFYLLFQVREKFGGKSASSKPTT